MRITYCEGSSVCLAEVTKITLAGKLLICQLKSVSDSGKPEIVARPFPDEDTCEAFFRQVICGAPQDAIINLENTNFGTRLGAMLEELDALYED